jgi:hypothetical protein
MRTPPNLTGHERTFDPGDIIVTKTDLKGRITYANRVFLNLSQLELNNTLEQPHSLIRHPGMPRTVFKLLWERIEAGKEIFAYVVNRAMTGITRTGASPTGASSTRPSGRSMTSSARSNSVAAAARTACRVPMMCFTRN